MRLSLIIVSCFSTFIASLPPTPVTLPVIQRSAAWPTKGLSGCPTIPSNFGTNITYLPDPFSFTNGDLVRSRNDWLCRQLEISTLLQNYELGPLPSPPDNLEAVYNNKSLTITASRLNASISFSVTIVAPNITNLSSYPAIIALGGANIPIPSPVATIVFNNNDIAQQNDLSSRGKGKFYLLFGSDHPAGAMTAWSWAISRIIDALELPHIQKATHIDPKRLGVTGCSRNGKGALVAGALDSRIALTIPQESGAGGAGCWRVENYQNAHGANVQGPQEIIRENVWFGPVFDRYVDNVDVLPFDHHHLAALVAPRALYVIENSDYEWLGNLSTYGCMDAARRVWQWLGVQDRFGYSQQGGHLHCNFPAEKQGKELNAFIDKFLLYMPTAGSTDFFRSDQNFTSVQWNQSFWEPWWRGVGKSRELFLH
jgi:hypothetical protein